MNDNWIDNVLKEQYQFVKALNKPNKPPIIVYRHKELGKSLVRRSVEGSGEVYFVLRTLFFTKIFQMSMTLLRPKTALLLLKNILTDRQFMTILRIIYIRL